MSTERIRGAALFAVLALVVVTVLQGCAPGIEEGSADETVDVEPVADVPEVEDPKEIPRDQGLSGILPGDFPENLPLYLPASLIDYGEEAGRPWVDLLTPRSQAAVEKGLRDQVSAAGWQVESPGSGVLSLAKAERKARITIRDGNPGTVYRIEY